VLVNEAAVRNFGWGDPANAIGKPFGKGEGQRFVIGVVKDFNFESLHKSVEPLLIGHAQTGGRFTLKTDVAHLSESISHLEVVWKQLGTGLPLDYRFVDSNLARQYGTEQKTSEIFLGFSGLSLVIACMGLFGLSVFTVRNKVKEIGIRKVLGANVPGIVGLLTKDFSTLVIVSAFIAAPLAWYIMRDWLLNFAFHVSIQWWVFIVTGVVALTVALLTVSVQSVKAAMENPTKNLRTE
jgi:putative ABC transport system permease protein